MDKKANLKILVLRNGWVEVQTVQIETTETSTISCEHNKTNIASHFVGEPGVYGCVIESKPASYLRNQTKRLRLSC